MDRIVKCMPILIICILLTGCWDRIEVNERLPIIYMGIDFADNNEYIVSVSIPNVTGLSGGPQATPEERKPVVISVQAETTSLAFEKMQSMMAREVFLGYIRGIIISENLAKNCDLNKFFDGIRREADVRPTAHLLITSEKIEDLLKIAPPEINLPITFLYRLIENEKQKQWLINTYLHNFITKSGNQGVELVLARIALKADRIGVDGLAVFKDNKMIGTLNSEELSDYVRLQGLLGKSIEMNCPIHIGDKFIIRPIKTDHKVTINTIEGDLFARISIKLKIEIIQKNTYKSHTEKEKIIEEAIAKEFEKRTTALIKKTQQEFKSDVFGLGLYVKCLHPNYWDYIDWDEYFPYMPIEVSYKVILENEQLLTNHSK